MNNALRSLILTLMISSSAVAQNFNLSRFTNASGLPQNYVYSLTQSPDGVVWIAMAEGLSGYDGIKFTNFFTRDSLADNFTSKMLIDSDKRLWCGHGNGHFSVYENHRFSRLFVPDVAAPIKDMCLDDKGNIWAVEQNKGLIKIAPDKTVTTYFDRKKFGRHIYYSVRAVNSMHLLVGTSDGLMNVRFDVDGTPRDPQEVDEIPCGTVNCIEQTREGKSFWIGMEDGMIYRYTPSGGEVMAVEQCSESCTPTSEKQYNIKRIYEDENGNLFLATWGDGLKEWTPRVAGSAQYIEQLSLNENNGLDNNFVSDILVDREGVFWFATYGGGVVAWINNYFAQYNLSDIGFHRNKVLAAVVEDDDLWLSLNNGMIKMDVQCITNFEYFDKTMGLPTSAITSVAIDKNTGIQYIGTDEDGVFWKDKHSQRYHRLPYFASSLTCSMINSMAVRGDKLYLATQGGFIIYDLAEHTTRTFTTIDGLPHNNINFVYIDNDGQVWLGPKDSGIAQYDPQSGFEIHRLSDVPINVAGLTHDDSNRLWVATVNNGVICTSNDTIISITTADGLEKNYCYGIAADGNGRIWVCHQPGLSCIDLTTGNIRSFNSTNGVGQEFTGVSADDNGDLWFSSSSGVVHYMSQYDRRNSVPPIINMTRVQISGKKHSLTSPIDLPYPYDGNVAKFEFDFVGICMKDPANVRYEYWLQMADAKAERWTPLGTQNHKEFDFLPEGDYVLHIRAFNSDGIACQTPLRIPIHIEAPFWKKIWFPIVVVFIIILVVRITTKWRERQLKARQAELEAEVNRQTAMLSRQKEEIQRKNKDIMDGINYAKHIQTAILPSRTGMKDYPFTDSFILFMPKDVVSGDFYWFNRYDDKVLVCCGDCTGHGVPGAFMSKIAATAINDATHVVVARFSPSKLLEKIDPDVKTTLNKNQTIEARDGMDCALLCIDLSTLQVAASAARRPIYFISGGRLTEQRGTRRSIGDHRNGNDFTETVTQLKKGDLIYMTSDGYGDQFGGDKADKYTAGALKRLLEKIADQPLDEQARILEREFVEWKGKHEQIDDVIVMGIRI